MRCIEDSKGWVGIFVAPNVTELFWAVDEFISPLQMEYAEADYRAAGMLVESNRVKVEDRNCDCEFYGDECSCREVSKPEVSDALDFGCNEEHDWIAFISSDDGIKEV